MLQRFLSTGFISILVLTALLFGGTYWLIGCFYETNDDIILTFLLSGFSGWGPITDLTLYLHGLSVPISKLYQVFPSWPWYGLGLYSLLFVVTLLAFRFIYYCLKPKDGLPFFYFLIILFYLANWYEHVFWFNYSRLAVLLSGMAGLNAWLDGQQSVSGFNKRQFGYGFLFFVALCIRPSFAFFGLGLVLPIFLLDSTFSRLIINKAFLLFLPFLLTGVLFSGYIYVKNNPAQKSYQQLDVLKSQIVDYNWCCPVPNKATEKLLYTGVNNWFLADKNIQVFLMQQQPDWRYFVQDIFILKLSLLLRELVFNHFLPFCLLAAHFIWLCKSKARRKMILLGSYHLYFWIIILAVGLIFKLPPRVLTPSISLLLLIHLAIFPPIIKPRSLPVFVKVFGALLLLMQMYKIAHRSFWQQQRQKQSETIITRITNNFSDHLVITAGLENELRALSPFKNYSFHNQQLLFLTGWQTLDPHFSGYLQSLTGQGNVAQVFESLSHRKKVIMVSNAPFVAFLEAYLKHFYHQSFHFSLIKPVEAHSSKTDRLYYYQIEKVKE
ncbi:MAG: hypothetical protein M3142_16030 [Bacteroidota bacterium]|nr:hypothetical protein [Bacteroidota bacterium]